MAHDQARQWAALGSEAVEGRYNKPGYETEIISAVYVDLGDGLKSYTGKELQREIDRLNRMLDDRP